MRDWFWCILTILIVGGFVFSHLLHEHRAKKYTKIAEKYRGIDDEPTDSFSDLDKKTRMVQANLQREKDIADLKRQNYSDDMIAVILPTLYSE